VGGSNLVLNRKERGRKGFRTETHRISVIELEPHDRAALQVMAKRYRVKSLIYFLEGCLSAEEKRTYRGSQVLFRVYED
jgi:hypothetical protein